jgi:hypothetical protein
MRRIVLFLLFFPLIAGAQMNKHLISDLESVVYEWSPDALAPSSINLPFKAIKIIDSRFDTTKLGFVYQKEYNPQAHTDFKKMKFAGGIQQAIENYYNEYYQKCFSDPDCNLLIVLKKLWIDNFPGNNVSGNTVDKELIYSFQEVHVKFECYFDVGNYYYPVQRIDTVYRLTDHKKITIGKRPSGKDLYFFNTVMHTVIEAIDFIQIKNSISQKRKLDLTSIDSFNRVRLQIPLLNTPLKHGVFNSFEELKNNNPALVDFEEAHVKSESSLFNKQTGTRLTNWFAVNDDNGLHVSSFENEIVIRSGNAFEIFRDTYMYVPKTIAGNMLKFFPFEAFEPFPGQSALSINPGDGTKLITFHAPCQLDLETGKFY